jgi:hypothetical protein
MPFGAAGERRLAPVPLPDLRDHAELALRALVEERQGGKGRAILPPTAQGQERASDRAPEKTER